MSAEIKSINGVLAAEMTGGTPNQETIERLDGLLEQARDGKLQCIAYAGICDTGAFLNGWVTQTKGDAVKLIGITHCMAADLAASLTNPDQD